MYFFFYPPSDFSVNTNSVNLYCCMYLMHYTVYGEKLNSKLMLVCV